MLDLQLNDISLRIINVYAPNNPAFFEKINDLVEESSESYVLICGDLNLTLKPSIRAERDIRIIRFPVRIFRI